MEKSLEIPSTKLKLPVASLKTQLGRNKPKFASKESKNQKSASNLDKNETSSIDFRSYFMWGHTKEVTTTIVERSNL